VRILLTSHLQGPLGQCGGFLKLLLVEELLRLLDPVLPIGSGHTIALEKKDFFLTPSNNHYLIENCLQRNTKTLNATREDGHAFYSRTWSARVELFSRSAVSWAEAVSIGAFRPIANRPPQAGDPTVPGGAGRSGHAQQYPGHHGHGRCLAHRGRHG
jgi:hypothetical protein